MLGSIQNVMQQTSSTTSTRSSWDDDTTTTTTTTTTGFVGGCLGGSAMLDWKEFESADTSTWTRTTVISEKNGTDHQKQYTTMAIFHSDEYKTLQDLGLASLQQAFLNVSFARLCEPLQYMFPQVNVDQHDNMSIVSAIPSKYDLQKLNEIICSELSMADPRQGGGELSMTAMIAENVVSMVEQFCTQAKGAVSNAGQGGCIRAQDGTATEALIHDIKIATVMVRTMVMCLLLLLCVCLQSLYMHSCYSSLFHRVRLQRLSRVLPKSPLLYHIGRRLTLYTKKLPVLAK
jgi:hypothetical protein